MWGQRLAAVDFANNDLNLSNVLSDGQHITGIVDWDEFGLNTRAIDLTAIAFDCEDALRALVSYRAIGQITALMRAGHHRSIEPATGTAHRVIDLLTQ